MVWAVRLLRPSPSSSRMRSACAEAEVKDFNGGSTEGTANQLIPIWWVQEASVVSGARPSFSGSKGQLGSPRREAEPVRAPRGSQKATL